MRIVLDLTVYSESYRGGVSTFTRGIVKGLLSTCPENVEIIALVAERNTICEEYGVEQIFLPGSLRKKLTLMLHRINYNLFNSNSAFILVKRIELPRSIRIRLRKAVIYTPTTYLNFNVADSIQIVSLHDCQEKRYPEYFEKKQLRYRDFNCKYTLKHSQKIQVSSKFIHDEIKKYYPEQTSNCEIVTIPEGVDINLFTRRKEIVKIEEQAIKVFIPSSLLPHKNHEELFEAMSYLDGVYRINISLTGNGLRRNYLESLAAKFKTIKASFMGAIETEQLIREYQQSDIVIVASKYESSSLPILEALSCGTFVIASDIQPHVEMRKKLDFEIYSLGSPQQLAIKISEFIQGKLKNNFDTRINDYDWKNIAMNYWEIFSEN